MGVWNTVPRAWAFNLRYFVRGIMPQLVSTCDIMTFSMGVTGVTAASDQYGTML